MLLINIPFSFKFRFRSNCVLFKKIVFKSKLNIIKSELFESLRKTNKI